MKQLILASSSPRRQELLSQLNIPFIVKKPRVDEEGIIINDPIEKVKKLALLKARDIPLKDRDLVLSADTIVTYNGDIFEKPKNQADAYQMIQTLSGRKHEVITAVAIRTLEKEHIFTESTSVYFYQLSEEAISAYVKTNEPYDKAGAYGIQGLARIFVKKIDGDYFNVVGLPIASVVKHLACFDFPVDQYIFQQNDF